MVTDWYEGVSLSSEWQPATEAAGASYRLFVTNRGPAPLAGFRIGFSGPARVSDNAALIGGSVVARTDVGNLMQALKLYKLDNQRYPTGEQGLEALVAKPSAGPIPANWKNYLEKLPNDPWGRPYQYANPGVKSEIDVFSLGADGQAGGEGKDADIGSWQ